ncbi:MAG TPA: hypothetical protein VFN45_02055, partial [Myxococcaceae bacterium]|nr:hypothetical protein [Myxococcaceae bacterium]
EQADQDPLDHLTLTHDHLPRLGGEEVHERALVPDPLGQGTDVDVQKFLLGLCGRRTVGSRPGARNTRDSLPFRAAAAAGCTFLVSLSVRPLTTHAPKVVCSPLL